MRGMRNKAGSEVHGSRLSVSCCHAGAWDKRILNGRVKVLLNVEHRTSNFEHRMMKSLRSADL